MLQCSNDPTNIDANDLISKMVVENERIHPVKALEHELFQQNIINKVFSFITKNSYISNIIYLHLVLYEIIEIQSEN